MLVEIIILLGFLFVLAVIFTAYRKSTLDRLAALPGETTLWEEQSVQVTQAGAPRTAFFPSCVVRLTDRRIIIAQTVPLMKNTHYLRAVILHSSLKPDTDLASTLRRGYLSFSIGEKEIDLSPNPHGLTVKIYIPNTTLIRRQYLEFNLRQGDPFFHTFRPDPARGGITAGK